MSVALSSNITFLVHTVWFSSPNDAGENRLRDQLKECLCVRQGGGTTVFASPLSLSLSFTFLKLFSYTQSVVRGLYLVRVLYSVRSPHFISCPCSQSAVHVLY